MLQSSKKSQIALDTATDLVYNSSMKNNNTSTKRENRMTTKRYQRVSVNGFGESQKTEYVRLHNEYQQVINNLWKKWDSTNSDIERKAIESNVQLMDSAINELMIYGVDGKPK
jgi:hypothetical protein|tara:strand:- start:284 stop:622 length:339 start_codon:yes stop_codon:yes gene_type:complete